MTLPSNRRRFLQRTALVGLAATAGCLSSGTPGSTATATDDGTDTSTAEPTTATDELSPPDDLESWLADANGYDGNRASFGVGDRPSIAVGHDTDDGMAFAPAVIEIPTQTEVHWEWTGHGGQQNVVALDGSFDSGRTNAQHGTCYSVFFEDPGDHAFVSEPHREDGMKGAVIVREPPSTGNETVDRWMQGSGNFDGEVVDRTDASSATVTVGAEGNGGEFAFEPPVLRVSTDTTVRWEWTGNGGAHNISFEGINVESGDPEAEAGYTFEHSFAESGTYLYSCLPHRALGMRGAVIVE